MKAILILDKMPERCGDCPLLQQWYDDEYEEYHNMCFWRYCKIEDTESKLNICPLKPIPSKYGRGCGRKEFIDEILGEE